MQNIILGVADGSIGFDELVEWTEQQLRSES